MFNDTFSNLRHSDGTVIKLSQTNIAWPSDIDKKFISPNVERLPVSDANKYGFVGKFCGAFGDPCSLQDAAHPDNDTIASTACQVSGWCNTPIDPNKPGSKFSIADLRLIAGYTKTNPADKYCCDGKLCSNPAAPALSSSQVYNCWHR
jgi:hypothetical protein